MDCKHNRNSNFDHNYLKLSSHLFPHLLIIAHLWVNLHILWLQGMLKHGPLAVWMPYTCIDQLLGALKLHQSDHTYKQVNWIFILSTASVTKHCLLIVHAPFLGQDINQSVSKIPNFFCNLTLHLHVLNSNVSIIYHIIGH